MNSYGPRRAVLSADRRELTILTQTPAGVSRAVFGRADGDEPFTEADVQRALAEAPTGRTMIPGQRNTTRRWVTPLGSIYGHLMTGPPTWWLPKVEIRRGGLMVGWLRAAVAVGVKRGGPTHA